MATPQPPEPQYNANGAPYGDYLNYLMNQSYPALREGHLRKEASVKRQQALFKQVESSYSVAAKAHKYKQGNIAHGKAVGKLRKERYTAENAVAGTTEESVNKQEVKKTPVKRRKRKTTTKTTKK